MGVQNGALIEYVLHQDAEIVRRRFLPTSITLIGKIMAKPNVKRIARNLGVAVHKINQDLNAGYLIDCIPVPRPGDWRRWDQKAYIATHFYIAFQDQGMTRQASSKLATAIAVFAENNPDEDVCAVIYRSREPLYAIKVSHAPLMTEWDEECVEQVSMFNLGKVRRAYNSAFGE